MSYYILPKTNNIMNVNPIVCIDENLAPYVSYSVFYYCNEILEQIKNICLNENDLSYNNYYEILKIVNPCEYIFSQVPGSKYSVSKLKLKSNIFYDFLEVCTTLNVLEPYKFVSIKTLHITNNSTETIECFEMLRENFNDEIICYNEINDETMKQISDSKFNFLFFEKKISNTKNYITYLIEILMLIYRNQALNGCCIIKISDIFYKPVIDILYILSSLYEKTYILKPNTSSVTSYDKYIVCKNFQTNSDKTSNFRLNYYKLLVFLKKSENKNIASILDFEIPYYFTMKLDDINIIVGQQQIEYLDMVMNILKTKNKDKIETIKKNNIQKSVAWCEKYKIPCNKFTEKTNIFLPINKEIKTTEPVETVETD